MSAPKAPLPPMSSYIVPAPAFTPCAICGCLVGLKRDAYGAVETVTPLLGYAHLCGENCACRFGKEVPHALP